MNFVDYLIKNNPEQFKAYNIQITKVISRKPRDNQRLDWKLSPVVSNLIDESKMKLYHVSYNFHFEVVSNSRHSGFFFFTWMGVLFRISSNDWKECPAAPRRLTGQLRIATGLQ